MDFAIWLLFSKCRASDGNVPHLLCQGFRKEIALRSIRTAQDTSTAIPGVVSTYPNSHVIAMKALPWPRVLTLMGNEGEGVMIDLILDCGIYVSLESGRGNYYQLSG